MQTVAQLAHTELSVLMRIIGRAQSQRLHQIAWHRYEWDIKPEREEKSVGTETTCDTDVRDRDELRRSFLALADRSAARARRDRKSTRLNSSHVDISYADFCLYK